MSGMRFVRCSARSRVSRAAVSAVLALWCLLSLASGTTRALCLDLRGDCSPAAPAPAGPCHDQGPESDIDPGCSSCIDIMVPQDASALHGRPDRDLRAPQATQALAAASSTLLAGAAAAAATVPPQAGAAPLDPLLRSAVLRI